MLRDKFGREIHDLRISVTDRCNFSCVYCKSADPKNYFPHRDLLTWEEFLRLSRVLVGLGIRKIRVTGGEPLLREGVVDFIARLRHIDGLEDVALTTNGYLLPEMARELAAAGAPRVTVSLDSTNPEKFARITRTPRSYEKVMAGIDAALEAGLRPVKVNIVLVRGFNDDEIVEFARLARRRDIVVRFIEFMPLDADHAWKRELVVTAKEIVDAIQPVFPLEEIPRHSPSETALRYRFADGQGETRHHRAGFDPFLRAVQPHPGDGGRQTAHLPLLAARARRAPPGSQRRHRPRHRQIYGKGGAPKGARPPDQRAGFRSAFANHGLHWGVRTRD